MEVARFLSDKEQGKIYGLMGNINLTTNNSNYKIITDYKFPDTVENYLNNEKAKTSLQMVMLNETYLNKKVEELSESDIKKINLASSLISNKDYLILDYFDIGLNHKEKENFKRLFRKLANDYHKTILLFTNDYTFLWDIAESIIIVDNNEVINTISKSNYFDIIEYINKPEICQMLDLIRAKNIKIDNYKNILDLLKAIYRLKGD